MIRRRMFPIITFSIITLAVAASLFQPIMYIVKSPDGFLFPLVHNYEPDYYWYLSLMKQGSEGSLLVTTRYTAETFASQWVNTFFPVLGMIAFSLGISLPVMYTISRIVFGWLLLFAGYKLSRTLIKQNNDRTGQHDTTGAIDRFSLIAVICMIFGVPFWLIRSSEIAQVGEFWTGFDPLLRITFLPHHLLANVCFILSLRYIISGYKRKTFTFFVKAGLSAFCAGWLNPGALGMLVMTVLFALLLGIIQKMFSFMFSYTRTVFSPVTFRKFLDEIRNTGRSYGVGFMIFFILSGSAMVLLLLVQKSVFPWTAFKDWERVQMYPINSWELAKALGIVGVLAFGAIPVVFAKKSFAWNLILSWFVVPFIGLDILVYYAPFSNGRYIQAAPHISAALLAIGALLFLYERLKKRYEVIVAVVVGIVFFSVPTLYASVTRQLKYITINQSNPVVYVKKDIFPLFEWLDYRGSKEDVILAPGWISTLIPVYTSLRSAFGHPTFTYKSDIKQSQAYDVLNMGDIEKAQSFLSENRVEYIMIESDPGTFGQYLKPLRYKKVRNQGTITVFKKE